MDPTQQGLSVLARLQGADDEFVRGSCRVCGGLGHLTKQCRNKPEILAVRTPLFPCTSLHRHKAGPPAPTRADVVVAAPPTRDPATAPPDST